MRKSLKSAAIHRLPELPALLFFLLFLVLGLAITGDYGIHWDDHSQYRHGLVTSDFIRDFFHREPLEPSLSGIRLEEYRHRTHGVVFQMLALSIQNLAGLEDPREFFLLRHYLTFIIFFTGLIFFYRILVHRFKNRALALLGVVMMILSPRIFADSFYNSKDIVFLSLTIINVYTLLRYLQHPNMSRAAYHALAGALLISTRITGIFMPVITLFFLLLKLIERKSDPEVKAAEIPVEHRFNIRSALTSGGSYLIFMLFLTVIFWPYLWVDPFRNLVEIFTAMSRFNWDDPVLFRGSFISPTALPWFYVPFWILITTPLLYSLLFIAGIVSLFFTPPGTSRGRFGLIGLALFFFPLLSVILLRSVIYDGWRQMFFLYVPFMMLAMTGFSEILDYVKRRAVPRFATWLRILLFGMVAFSWAGAMIFMIRSHPHQNVYFNCLAGKEPTRDFEADYWGLSYRQVLEHLLEQDPSDTIKIVTVNWPGQANADILPVVQRNRLKFTSLEGARYYISNYRFPAEHNKFHNREFPYDYPVFEVTVRNKAISGAYLLTREPD